MAKAIKAKKLKQKSPSKVKKGFSVLKKELTAKDFIAQLKAHQSDAELKRSSDILNQEKGIMVTVINLWE